MKNSIKKISAVAMALTLIGTGTSVVNTLSPEADNSITANAANNSYQSTYPTNWIYYNQPNPNATYNVGAYGNQVKWIQHACNLLLSYRLQFPVYIAVDGAYGPDTRRAVMGLQDYLNTREHCSLDVDGSYGPKTHKALAKFLNAELFGGKKVVRD